MMMKTLNMNEIEAVAGGLPFLALPAVITAIPVRPTPKPADEPISLNMRPAE
jgi:hypothetical protein